MDNIKVRLRAMEPEDVDYLYLWENDPDIWKVSSTLAPYSRFVLEQYVAESMGKDVFEQGQLRLVIEDSSTHEPVGLVDLFDVDLRDSHGSIGISINNKNFRGKGYASEALRKFVDHCFHVLGLHSLFARIDAGNEPSIRLFENCGFQKCGILRQWRRIQNGWSDIVEVQIINN
ncbi:MAG: GNAT family N-acetyltransferase [Bacteroidales bacterium]|nr:GNAT family N-acetyltransferase [Bacteroidales bacterium]